MKPTKILIITTSVLLLISMYFYLGWKFNPLRKATESEKLNFKLYGNFYHGRIDKFSASIYSVLYNSNLVKSSEIEVSKVNENKKEITTDQNTNVNKDKEIGCSGFGNESCIDKVRENFVNTGKQILGEEYLGEGLFGISFLDASKGQTFNSKVSTDCNCKILNVDVSIMR